MASRHRSRSQSPTHNRTWLSPEDDRDRRIRRGNKEKYKDRDTRPLPYGAEPLQDSDYYLKNAEFRSWLKEEKDIFFDELSGEKARSYFRKFVKAWNRGKLPKSYYSHENALIQPAASQTAYRWPFASKSSKAERAALDETRHAVETATHSTDLDTSDSVAAPAPQLGTHSGRSRVLGPTLPSASDRILLREAQEESRAAERSYERKRAREEDKERIEDLVGPKERGREGMLEKKKARREADRATRDAKDDAFGDYDESTLMGGGDSFQARIAQRDAARRRFKEKRSSMHEEKESAVKERQEALRAKDKATMDMFKQMAKERFGG
ncbi:uncharacterized protein FOMMEDRAFT_83603 [Fomitiporia mediterranea MF3/22]|uniref:uncharacterized protein n=1 Tax=Fomitiporia mediterranea (strain MF3/22) TaxID=694068 RepID=UPI0004407564|nr:uncharacterized protein FOMMEDRAFT_83603 [Fomitiporia mediterranea MF3/22]EJD03527.1 hypothetical protein FOMMEDRAFT_83603 [Fomitiporia mediterranea MF3/22]